MIRFIRTRTGLRFDLDPDTLGALTRSIVAPLVHVQGITVRVSAIGAPLVGAVLQDNGEKEIWKEIEREFGIFGEDLEDPLPEMVKATDPVDVRNPIGRAVLDENREKFRIRLPLDDRTGKQLKLRPFQEVGIGFARLTGYRSYIGDSPGLGKTQQAMGCILVDPEKLLPACVVAPTSTLLKWRDELSGNEAIGKTGWLPSVPVWWLDTGSAEFPPRGWKGIILLGWDLLRKHADGLAEWGVQLFVGDEAHYIKGFEAQRSQAAARLGAAVPHVLFLSGTAMKNATIELHHQLSILDPETWSSRADFGARFSNVTSKNAHGREIVEYTGVKNEDELKAELSRVLIRRLKRDVAKDLPEKQRIMEPVLLTPREIEAYNQIAQAYPEWLREQKTKKLCEEFPGLPIKELRSRVRDDVERALRAEKLTQMGYLRRAIGVAKVRAAGEFVRGLVEQGEPVIAFCEHHDVVRGLEAECKRNKLTFTTVGGPESLSSEERIRRANAFQAGQYDVFIGTKAAKEGLDLFISSNVVFLERWWTPADEEQAEDRSHRIGTTAEAVTIWSLYVPDSIDEKLNRIVEAKRLVFDTVLGGEGARQVTRAEIEGVLDEVGDGRIGKSAGPGARAARHARERSDDESKIPDPAFVHMVLFRKDAWAPSAAKHWASMHRYASLRADQTDRWWRIEARERYKFRERSFRVEAVTDTVRLVIGDPLR
jgi:SNF2 family DNA or RNA helicase